jgi:hypothetical protein
MNKDIPDVLKILDNVPTIQLKAMMRDLVNQLVAVICLGSCMWKLELLWLLGVLVGVGYIVNVSFAYYLRRL